MDSFINTIKRNEKWAWLCLFFIFFIWFSLFLGNRPLATPDEGRYIEIPREMLATKDFITPRLNGVKYFEKPPLMYWIQTFLLKTFGLKEGFLRLGITFFAALSCFAITLFTSRFFSLIAGLMAGGILASSPLYYALGRLIILDMPVTSLMTLAMVSFLATVQTPIGCRRRLYAYGFYGFSALGVLTKGIMVVGVMGPIILIWSLLCKRWKDLWPAYLPTGFLIFIGIAAPWHILAALKNPEFLHKYFVVEHFLRYTTSLHLRSKPFWFFAPILTIGFFPWIFLLKDMIKTRITLSPSQRSILSFLWIWSAFIFVFFSVGDSKLVPYILPIFPALSIICGVTISGLLLNRPALSFMPFLGIFALLFSTCGLLTLYFIPSLIEGKETLYPCVFALIFLFGAGGVGFLWAYKNLGFYGQLLSLPLFSLLFIAILIPSGSAIQRTSLKPLIQHLLTIKQPGDRIVSYCFYPQDLPPYLNQTISVVEAKGELAFGTEVEDTTKWMITLSDFITLWHEPKRLLVVVREDDLKSWETTVPNSPYFVLYKYDNYSIITNFSPTPS